MSLPQYRYPLDKTGVNPDNYVADEQHSLNPQANIENVRVLAPDYGPFFSDSVEVKDRADNRILEKNVDYKITDLLQDPVLKFAKPIGQFIVITNGLVSNEVSISYQVLGGNFQNDATAVQHVYETFLNDTRPIDWSSITGKPVSYPPSLHIQMLEDVIGFGPMIVALEQIKEAILLGNTPVIQSMIDWVENRKTPWVNITGAETNIVTVNRVIDTPEEGGLAGGGDLHQDLTLSLRRLHVSDAIYGSPSTVPVFNVDIYGRISEIETVDISIPWYKVLDKPTTAEDYGITDVVDLTTNQTIEGLKVFERVFLGQGSASANIDDPVNNSAIVTLDYLNNRLAQAAGSGSNAFSRFFFSQI